VIVDKLQGSLATYLRHAGVVNNKIKRFTDESVSENICKISEYLAKVTSKKWLSRALCAPGHHTATESA